MSGSNYGAWLSREFNPLSQHQPKLLRSSVSLPCKGSVTPDLVHTGGTHGPQDGARDEIVEGKRLPVPPSHPLDVRILLGGGPTHYSLRKGQVITESWRHHYNTVRPYGSIGYRLPAPEVFVSAFAAWPAAQPSASHSNWLRHSELLACSARPAPPAMLTLAPRPDVLPFFSSSQNVSIPRGAHAASLLDRAGWPTQVGPGRKYLGPPAAVM